MESDDGELDAKGFFKCGFQKGFFEWKLGFFLRLTPSRCSSSGAA